MQKQRFYPARFAIPRALRYVRRLTFAPTAESFASSFS